MTKRKSHNAKKFPYVWIAAVLLLAGGAVYAGLYLEKSTVIKEIEFTGNYYTETDELQASFKSPLDMVADSVSFNQILEDLKTPPYVKGAHVTMSSRGVLNFRVTEHQPIAMITNNVQRYYLAEGGFILPVITGKTEDVPILYAWEVVEGKRLSGVAYDKVEGFLLAARNNRFAWITISEISWDSREGVTALSSENGIKLIFGKEGFAEKLSKWELFYSQVAAVKGLDVFHTVDLRFEDQIVTKNS